MSNKAGVLYVVATPIGNLADIGRRAIEVLSAVDLVVAEDTRHTGRLLRHLGIDRPQTACHEHNEREVTDGLAAKLLGGASLALVSDAGTPLVSDPGFRLVRAAREAGVEVVPVPGPCAAVAALSVAGLPTDRFAFEGFLPAREAARRARLEELAGETRTLVFYEAGRRLAACLADLRRCFGAGRRAVLARELTKLHETVIAAELGELETRVADDPDQARGESVLVVAGASAPDSDRDRETDRLLGVLLDEGLPVSRAAAVAARICDVPKRRLYARAQELHDTRGGRGE
ncbi:MAG: 16S rRNA (cytidine(1402)-2'-O)-methyltransferase [Gammaproteobacteria bacterium]|nr:16S rRNA (cytidine(1402)-2'-O)-methyltransferase [Gammaproteobacteria bacterium]